jgi:hypothetical protein
MIQTVCAVLFWTEKENGFCAVEDFLWENLCVCWFLQVYPEIGPPCSIPIPPFYYFHFAFEQETK